MPEMTTLTYELMRVGKIESVQPAPDGKQVALWFTDTNGRLVCLVMPAGVALGEPPTVN